METYPASDFIEVVDITRNRYDQWMHRKLIRADVKSRRQGSRSGWSLNNMIHGVMLKHLSEAGVNLDVATELATESLQEESLLRQSKVVTFYHFYCELNIADPTQRKFHTRLKDLTHEWPATLVLDLNKFSSIAIKRLGEIHPEIYEQPPEIQKMIHEEHEKWMEEQT